MKIYKNHEREKKGNRENRIDIAHHYNLKYLGVFKGGEIKSMLVNALSHFFSFF